MIGQRQLRTRGPLSLGLALVAVLVPGVATANAATAQEERHGAAVLGQLEAGRVECGDLGPEQFEHIGDYAMGRLAGSTARHEAMDETMTRMMGSTAERQMHEAIGRRFSGCGGGRLPEGFAQMMGAFGAMGVIGGGGPGSMMGGGHWSELRGGDGDSDGPSAAATIGMMAVFVAAVAAAVLWLSRRRPRGPLDTLQRRFAAGELNSAEYEERRRLLGGG